MGGVVVVVGWGGEGGTWARASTVAGLHGHLTLLGRLLTTGKDLAAYHAAHRRRGQEQAAVQEAGGGGASGGGQQALLQPSPLLLSRAALGQLLALLLLLLLQLLLWRDDTERAGLPAAVDVVVQARAARRWRWYLCYVRRCCCYHLQSRVVRLSCAQFQLQQQY